MDQSHARQARIREALLAHPDFDDRAIARIAGVDRWSQVRTVRAALVVVAVEPAPAPAPARAEWEVLSEALVRMITREDDPKRKHELRLALLRTRHTPYMEARCSSR